MNHAADILNHLPSPDFRSGDQLARDLEDEFAFHLEQLERELIACGDPPEVARERARERFGDIDQIRIECAAIARKEQIIMQRILTIVLSLVTIIVLIACFFLYREAQESRAIAIDSRMQAEEARMHAETELRKANAVQAFLTQHFASVDPQRQSQVSVSELLDAAATRAEATFHDQPEMLQRIREAIEKSRGEMTNGGNAPNARGASEMDPSLADLPGEWEQVLAEGSDGSPARLSIYPVGHIRNLEDTPTGRLFMPHVEDDVPLTFSAESETRNLRIHMNNRRNPAGFPGRWVMIDDQLVLNISSAASDNDPMLQAPLSFQKISDTPAAGSPALTSREHVTGSAASIVHLYDLLPGRWRQVESEDSNGTLATLIITAEDDLTNLLGKHVGEMVIPSTTTPLRMTFHNYPSRSSTNLALHRIDNRGTFESKWSIENGKLFINVTPLNDHLDDITLPATIVFEKVDEAEDASDASAALPKDDD